MDRKDRHASWQRIGLERSHIVLIRGLGLIKIGGSVPVFNFFCPLDRAKTIADIRVILMAIGGTQYGTE